MTNRYAKIIDNLQHAMGVLGLVPEDRVDLGIYQINTSRGPLRDVSGWLAQSEFFQAQGMRLLPHGAGYALFNAKQPEAPVVDTDWLDDIFGLHAYARLFAAYGEGDNDKALCIGLPMPSDRRLGLLRLQRQLDEYRRANVLAPALRSGKERVHA